MRCARPQGSPGLTGWGRLQFRFPVIRDEIAALLRGATEAAQHTGLLPQVTLPDVTVEPPQRAEHGDYTTNLAMRLARAARMAPQQIAQILIQSLPENELVASADVAGAGFINFTLRPELLASRVETILHEGERFGHNEQGGGRSVQVEFVSANPTERLHAGSGRGAALGDSLANLLTASGWKVQREYYVNDAGSRLEALGQTVLARYLQALGHPAEVPKEGYHSEYLAEYGKQLAEEHGDRFMEMDQPEAVRELTRGAVEKFVALHKADMDSLGIRYDNWYREEALHERNDLFKVVQILRDKGYVAEREGAVWFSSTALGDDKDNVLIRGNGVPAYLASDIAYHRDKFLERRFDRVIDIWGADHQGHVSRMKAAVQALDVDSDRLTIIIHQMITLKRGEELVKLSKRAGNIVALADVIEEVGKDACRFFFVSRSADSHQEFDLELAQKETNENPVFYVQYSHARTASILEMGRERGVSGNDGMLRLEHPSELALARALLRYPELLHDAATQLEPHRLTYFAQELASVFNAFYRDCRVLPSDRTPEDPPRQVSESRLLLVAAAKQVLANTLAILGVSAPERMARLEEEPTG